MFQPGSPNSIDREGTQFRSRNPFDFITNFFRRKTTKESNENKDSAIEVLEDKALNGDDCHNSSSDWGDQTDSGISFREIDDSPVLTFSQKNMNPRKLDEDMEYLRLSRHDNPVLQRHLSSSPHSFEASSNSSNCNDDQDTQHLVSTMDESADEDFVQKSGFYNQMHEHLIRSPPPNPCSLPEISAANNVFMFPPVNKSEQSRSLEPLHMLSSTPLDARNGNNQRNVSRRLELNPVQTKRGSEMIDPTLRQLLNAQNKTFEKPTYSRSSSSPLPSNHSTPCSNRIGIPMTPNSRSGTFSTPAQPLSASVSKESHPNAVYHGGLAPLKSRPD